MPKVSKALTVAEKAMPVVSAVAACTEIVFGGPGLTAIGFELPAMEAVTVSVAVIVWLPLPTLFSVTEKVPAPFVSVEFAGSTAWLSELVK